MNDACVDGNVCVCVCVLVGWANRVHIRCGDCDCFIRSPTSYMCYFSHGIRTNRKLRFFGDDDMNFSNDDNAIHT